ncbi:sugar transferase [Runella aurantiaca]|uniref:Sugar transferase n=1 Tax=Runella aurantiaca TaxID=2282308 RepID=A0A369I3Q2_9BACT|nr:sugar transferase [Runella aurantiaca]RDB04349.1 sugar transferase [Runella aurantiaca]
MSHRQLNFIGTNVPISGISKDILEMPMPNLACKNAVNQAIPAYLLKFGSHSSWSQVEVDVVLMRNFSPRGPNLYLDELMLKKYSPNVVLEKIRGSLGANGYFALKIVTAENIKCEIQKDISPFFLRLYYPVHFLFRRVLPKLAGFSTFYRKLQIHVDMSKAEIMGRLIYNGFQIVDVVDDCKETLIIAKINRRSNPSLTNPEASEGVVFRMNRIGKGGKKMTVYKFRSMHPYAEYVQEYLHSTQGLEAGGKFKNDFRVSTGGRLIRKYWIDELPMLYNLLRGDIKLIGVRPISEHYFGLYPEKLQALRKKHTPGLLPPYYADLPETFEEIVASELTYLEAYEKAPFKTDVNYLWKILKNIVINKARSK